MENAPKKYLAEKIAKNINQRHNISPALKAGDFLYLPKLKTQICASCMQKCKTYANAYCLHTKCSAYAMQLNYIILN